MKMSLFLFVPHYLHYNYTIATQATSLPGTICPYNEIHQRLKKVLFNEESREISIQGTVDQSHAPLFPPVIRGVS